MIDHVLIHIGGPKSLSTSLQRSFFLKHSQIHFAGIGYENNSYFNPDIELIFESLIKYATRTFWLKNLKTSQKAIHDFIDPKLLNVFSSEHLGFSFTPTALDIHEKLDRLLILFEDSCQLLFIIRNQVDLLKSLFKEFVKMGAIINFSEFIEYVYNFQDRNFYFELMSSDFIDLLKLKGFSKLHILFFEELVENDSVNLNIYFEEKFQLKNENIKLLKENPSLTDLNCQKLLHINQTERREMGNGHFNPFEKHRSKALFDFLKSGYFENEIYQDVLMKRDALQKINSIQLSEKNIFRLSSRAGMLYNRMLNDFRESNAKLQEILDRQLPIQYDF